MTRAAPISAGELDQVVSIDRRVGAPDAVGQGSDVWEPVVEDIFARARPLRMNEFFRAGATQSQESIVFGIRYRAGFDAAMRVRWKGRAYELTAEPVDVDGGRHTLELYCKGGRSLG